MASQAKSKVAIFYHFYPHYRSGVIEELQAGHFSGVSFYAGRKGVDGIKEYTSWKPSQLHVLRTFRLGNIVIQPGAVLACLFEQFDCGVFLADPNHLTTWLAALVCKARKKRVVFWGHGFKSVSLSAKNLLRRRFFRLADAFFTYGYRAKVAAERMGFDSGDVYVGFNSLNYPSQLATRLKCLESQLCDDGAENLRIVCISRLTKACKYEMLFEAISLARSRGLPPPSVVVIGDGEERLALVDRALALGVDVQFIGALYDETAIASEIFRADVTVSPGKVGLTAMHSLMYGTPVISNDDFVRQMPEVEAIAPGFTGDLFVAGDVSDLADKLLTFKSRYPSRDLTRQRCFAMMDKIYNPRKQAEVLTLAVRGIPAALGDDAFRLFEEVIR